MPCVALITALPISFNGIGVRELLMAEILSLYYGVPADARRGIGLFVVVGDDCDRPDRRPGLPARPATGCGRGIIYARVTWNNRAPREFVASKDTV